MIKIYISTFILSALYLLGFPAQMHTAAASYIQNSSVSGERYSPKQCRQSAIALAKKKPGQSETAESKALYKIWSSASCREYRDSVAFNVEPEMRDIDAMLKKNGIDIDTELSARVAECPDSVAKEWAKATAKMRSKNTIEGMLARCRHNARIELYAKAINKFNLDRQSPDEIEAAKRRHQIRMNEYEKKKKEWAAKIIADRAEYERKYAEWQKAVRLCRAGNSSYCKK